MNHCKFPGEKSTCSYPACTCVHVIPPALELEQLEAQKRAELATAAADRARIFQEEATAGVRSALTSAHRHFLTTIKRDLSTASELLEYSRDAKVQPWGFELARIVGLVEGILRDSDAAESPGQLDIERDV